MFHKHICNLFNLKTEKMQYFEARDLGCLWGKVYSSHISPTIDDKRFATSTIYGNTYNLHQALIFSNNIARNKIVSFLRRRRKNSSHAVFKTNMAENETRVARLTAIAKWAINSDVDFIELVREFPTIFATKE